MAQVIKFSDIVAAQKNQQMAVNAEQLQELTRAVIHQSETQSANQESFIQNLNDTLKKGFDKVTNELKSIGELQSKLGVIAAQGSKYTPQSALQQIKGGIQQMGTIEGFIDVEKSTGLIGNALKRRQARKEFIQEQMEMDTTLTGTNEEKKVLLTERFKEVEKLRSQANVTNNKVDRLREKGYSDTQIERTSIYQEMKQINERLQQVDALYKERLEIENQSQRDTTLPLGQSRIKVNDMIAANDPLITSEEKQQDALKIQQDVAGETIRNQIDTIIILRQQEDILKKVEENTRAFLTKEISTSSGDGIELSGKAVLGGGKAIATGARAALSGGARLASVALPYAAPAAIAYGAANVVDYGVGKLGIGKDAEGNDIAVNAEQDDKNWEKMTTFQKLQSGFARGIEKTGSFVGLSNIAREAQAKRIESETKYLQKLEPAQAPSMANIVEGQSIEVGTSKQSISSAPVVINAPQSTNIDNSTSNFGGKPVTRNTDSTMSDLNRSRYRFA